VDHGVAFEAHGQDVAGFEGDDQGFAVMQEGKRAAPGDGLGKVRHQWYNKFCAIVFHRRLLLLARRLTRFLIDYLKQARLLRITPSHHNLSWAARLLGVGVPGRMDCAGVQGFAVSKAAAPLVLLWFTAGAGDRSAGILWVPSPLINALASTRRGCVWTRSRTRLRRSSKLNFIAQES
jgi:hypothetical protein